MVNKIYYYYIIIPFSSANTTDKYCRYTCRLWHDTPCPGLTNQVYCDLRPDTHPQWKREPRPAESKQGHESEIQRPQLVNRTDRWFLTLELIYVRLTTLQPLNIMCKNLVYSTTAYALQGNISGGGHMKIYPGTLVKTGI